MRRLNGNCTTDILWFSVPTVRKMDDKKNDTKGIRTMNKLTIIGNLTAAPELRTTSQGTPVCSFSVAVNRRKANEDGSHDADFFRVTAWRQLGENCAKFLDKGRKVCVIGAVALHTYTKNDGTTGASMEVVAEDVEFLSPRVSDETPAQPANVPAGFAAVESDELPF